MICGRPTCHNFCYPLDMKHAFLWWPHVRLPIILIIQCQRRFYTVLYHLRSVFRLEGSAKSYFRIFKTQNLLQIYIDL